MALMLKKHRLPNNKGELVREPLAWLFVAEFADGTTIEQGHDDKSQTRTDGTGSRFTDVLARESELVAFHLKHTDGKQMASVDLRTGAFILNGTPFIAHDQYFDPAKHELKLVYFRETRVDKEVLGTVMADGSVKQEVVGARHYVNRYFIGWETQDAKGKAVKQLVAVG